MEENLWRLHEELAGQTYQPGPYTTFQIYEPKPRMISAAPFRDRVIHHALINIIGPLFEKSFIFDSYANCVGKGTHRGIRRYQHLLRDYRYVLKCDIRKYFPTIWCNRWGWDKTKASHNYHPPKPFDFLSNFC